MTDDSLYQELQTLRVEDPVLWAILLGKRMAPTISAFLIMHEAEVEIQIARLLKAQGIIWSRYMGRDLLRPSTPHLRSLAKYARTYQGK